MALIEHDLKYLGLHMTLPKFSQILNLLFLCPVIQQAWARFWLNRHNAVTETGSNKIA